VVTFKLLEKYKTMIQIKSISVIDLKPGQWFKQSTTQRKFRYAAKVIDWKNGDTEFLRGKRLIIQENCQQILMPIESIIFIPA
jgi:hypothetical protein